MHRQWLLDRLTRYKTSDTHEQDSRDQIIRFVQWHPDCFERALLIGHITGSAWIINPTRTRVLLTHHRKLDRWLQLGGHADGEGNILDVARREAQEESGISEVHPLSDEIFDVDIHEIPAFRDDPTHLHHDIRFLFEMDDRCVLQISPESNDLTWVEISRFGEYSNEESLMRMVRKSLSLTNNLREDAGNVV